MPPRLELYRRPLQNFRISLYTVGCIICVECTERAMKEKNNARIERGHAEEREEICMLHTFIDYLAFLYTPPPCEVRRYAGGSIPSS